MSKVLLINPQFNIPRENYDGSLSMGIFCLATYLQKRSVNVKIIDAARQKNYQKILERELPETTVVGLSVMTTQLPSALQISKLIKNFNKKITVVWGGFHPTLFPESTVAHPLVDIAVLGEGEETLWEIVKNHGRNLKNIPGIVFEENGQKIRTPERTLLEMKSLPLPDWDLMPEDVLQKLTRIPIHTSRGCPHVHTSVLFALMPLPKTVGDQDQLNR